MCTDIIRVQPLVAAGVRVCLRNFKDERTSPEGLGTNTELAVQSLLDSCQYAGECMAAAFDLEEVIGTEAAYGRLSPAVKEAFDKYLQATRRHTQQLDRILAYERKEHGLLAFHVTTAPTGADCKGAT